MMEVEKDLLSDVLDEDLRLLLSSDTPLSLLVGIQTLRYLKSLEWSVEDMRAEGLGVGKR